MQRVWVAIVVAAAAATSSLAGAQESPPPRDCFMPPDGWYTVCDFNARQCILSASNCIPFNDLSILLSDDLGIGGSSAATQWTIFLDPWNSTLQCFNGENNWNSCKDDFDKDGEFNTCLTEKGVTDVSTAFSNNNIADMHAVLLCMMRTRTNLNTAVYEHTVMRVPTYNYVTVKSVKTIGGTDFAAVMPPSAQTLTARTDFPLCRAMEFAGHDITVQDVHLYISKCQDSFQREVQWDGDDTTILAFSGPDATNNQVSNVEFYAKNLHIKDVSSNPQPPSDLKRFMNSTGVRFQENGGGTQAVSNVTLEKLTFNFIDTPVVFWNAARGGADSKPITWKEIDGENNENKCGRTSQCGSSAHQTEMCGHKCNCGVYFKQADENPPDVDRGNETEIEATSQCWRFHNMSSMLGPGSALYEPQNVAPVRGEGRCASHSELAVIASYFAIGCGCLLLVVSLIYEMEHRTRDFHGTHLDVLREKKKM